MKTSKLGDILHWDRNEGLYICQGGDFKQYLVTMIPDDLFSTLEKFHENQNKVTPFFGKFFQAPCKAPESPTTLRVSGP